MLKGFPYSQGTWTPVLLGAATPGTFTYASQQGTWEKIGRLVIARFQIQWTAITSAPAGSLEISGLPFTAGSDGGKDDMVGNIQSGTIGVTFDAGNTSLSISNIHSTALAGVKEYGSNVGQALPSTNLGSTGVIAGTLIYHI